MHSATFKFICPPIGLILAGTSASGHSPTVDILGSYFPAWIICIVLGLALTLVTRQLLVALKVNTFLHPAPLVYVCMQILFTLILWLAFFKN